MRPRRRARRGDLISARRIKLRLTGRQRNRWYRERMSRDKTRIALNVLMGLIAVVSASALAYRFYYHGEANEIAKFLCGERPMITGKYGDCLRHYRQP